jgi:alkylhydroperoxidase/carboxymuconolactone decarboxylase family protein YurZ
MCARMCHGRGNKLGVSVGSGFERTVHIHAKKALCTGANPDALRQIVLVAPPTIGLPTAFDALRWVDESIGEVGSDTR